MPNNGSLLSPQACLQLKFESLNVQFQCHWTQSWSARSGLHIIWLHGLTFVGRGGSIQLFWCIHSTKMVCDSWAGLKIPRSRVSICLVESSVSQIISLALSYSITSSFVKKLYTLLAEWWNPDPELLPGGLIYFFFGLCHMSEIIDCKGSKRVQICDPWIGLNWHYISKTIWAVMTHNWKPTVLYMTRFLKYGSRQ